MDPAHVSQVLAAHGAAIGQLHQDILEIRQELAALRQAVKSWTQQLVSAPQAVAPSVAIPTIVVTPPRDSKACNPEPFDGWCRAFLLQCRLVFCQRSRLFTSNESKKNFIISLLYGRALTWAQASSSGMRLSSLTFEEFVERIFDRPNHEGCAADRLFTIQQGDRSVAEYTVEFGTLSAKAGWDEAALRNAFSCGLTDWVQDAVSGTHPGTLNELIDQADNYQRERRCERSFRINPPRSIQFNSILFLHLIQ